MKKPFVILSGPTAVGKTGLSLSLAKKIGGEIISADSMQVYKGMDIGTAKIKKEEMQGVPHFLIDILEPDCDFNVVKFKELANEAVKEIYSRSHIPILVGGTGFYIQSVLYDIDFVEQPDKGSRSELEELARERGEAALFELLKNEDKVTAATIHPNNVKKVIRALEFHRETGLSLAEHNREQRIKTSPYNFAYFVLTCDRKKLYENINKRVDIMMEQGLLDEVKELKEKGINRNCTSMAGLGYRQLISHIEGECSLEEAVDKIKLETRHFAKRQLTWFRRERDVIWLDKDVSGTEEGLLMFMENILKEKNIRGI